MTDLKDILTSAVETLTGLDLDNSNVGSPTVGKPGGAQVVQSDSESAPFQVSHVADFNRRYIGEPLTLFTRLDVLQAAPGLTVQISLPANAAFEEYSTSPNVEDSIPEAVVTTEGRYLIWRFGRALRAGERFEFESHTTIPFATDDTDLTSTALAFNEQASGVAPISDSVQVRVKSKGNYLKYLPALYYDDEVMGRFLMLFESFWGPIDKQIDSIWYYFDPKLTPSDFLPWLASWSDLALDERWTEEQQRKLLGSAARLYRMRGTKRSLIEFLEIYTGQRAVITEHRANNLRLGKDSRFGHSVALGRSNQPHAFSVSLRLPPLPITEGDDAATRQRKEQDRRNTIVSIIEAEKPAHTTYSLIIQEDK